MTAQLRLRPYPALLLLSAAFWLPALAYETRLQDGTRVQVDPRTNRATILDSRGGATPLWDGVHRLQDGSIVTIRSGVMVPNMGMVQSQRQLPTKAETPSADIDVDHACGELVHKVCGPANQCQGSQPCSAARQLQDMDAGERADLQHRGPDFTTATKCQEALRDPGFFAPCPGVARR
jgi:hypothetical protein